MKYLLFTLLFLVASFGYGDSKTDTTIVPKKAGGAVILSSPSGATTITAGATNGTSGVTITSGSTSGQTLLKGNTVKMQTYSGGWQDRLTILNDGKVGIGQTPSTYKLEVAGDIFNGGSKYISNRSGGSAWDSNGLHLQIDGTTYGKIGMHNGSYIRTNAGMYIEGSVGIGVNPPTVALDVNGTIKAGGGIVIAGTPTAGMVGEVISFSSFPVIQVLVSDQTNEGTWRDVSGVATQVVTKGTWFYEIYMPAQYGTTSGYIKGARIALRDTSNNIIVIGNYPMIGGRLGINPATNSDIMTTIFTGKVVISSDVTLKLSGQLNAYDTGATGSLTMRFDLYAHPYFYGPAYIRFTRML